MNTLAELVGTTHLLLFQLVVAAALTGIIWIVQLLVYPQFLNVDARGFSRYHQRHMFGIGLIVAPLMILELALSGLAVWYFQQHPLQNLMVCAGAITIALWLTTFLVHVPLHRRLDSGWSEQSIQRLISTNWVRTILWTTRLGLLCWAMLI